MRGHAQSVDLAAVPLAQEDKSSFAMAYFSNKDKKDFQWARDFIQKVNVSKVDEEACHSKYMTRNSIELGHGSNFHEAAKWNKNSSIIFTLINNGADILAFDHKGSNIFEIIESNAKLKSTDGYWDVRELQFK